MYRATKDIILPTTITGSLPRPSWYTENLGTRHFSKQWSRAASANSTRTRSALSARPGDRRPRHRHRRRLPLRRRRRRAELDQLSADHMAGFDARQSAADAGRPRRHRVSARPHPARLSGSARDADGRARRPRRPAVHRDLEGRAALDRKAGEVRHRDGGTGCFRGPRQHYKSLPDRIIALADAFNEELHDLADAGCQVIQIEEPQIHLLARVAQRHGDQPGVHARSVQRYGERVAREDRGLVPHLLGQPFAAADVRAGAELQARARALTRWTPTS